MRRGIAALSMSVVAAAILGPAPSADANDDPNLPANVRAEKDAAAAVRRITKPFVKEVLGNSRDTVKEINGLAKDANKAKSVEDLERFFADLMSSVAQFHAENHDAAERVFDAFAADPAIQSYGTTTAPGRVAGGGGAPDDFRKVVQDALIRSGTPVVDVAGHCRDTLAENGLPVTVTIAPSITVNVPRFGPDPGPVCTGPEVLAVGAGANGTVFGVTIDPAATSGGGFPPVADSRVLLGGTWGAQSLSQIGTYNHIQVFRYTDGTLAQDFGPPVTLPREPEEPTSPENLLVLFYAHQDSSFSVPGSDTRTFFLPKPCPTPAQEALADPVRNVTDVRPPRRFFSPLAPDGLRFNSNLLLDPKLSQPFVNQQYLVAVPIAGGAPRKRSLDLGRFPCGAGPNGFTVCPTIPAQAPGGDLLAIGVAFEAAIPLADPVNRFQYGFVFDQDGIAANNYVPVPQFAGDYYRGTDKWYSVEYTPALGWRLIVTDARNGGFVQVASAAIAVISGKSIVLAVPASEFSVPNPAFRTTSFRHSGDFGQNPPHDWSADYDPAPDQPLRPFPAE